MAEENTNEIFIDADAGFAQEKNSYEVIILNQINKCVNVLSREMIGGNVVYKESKTGTEKYIEDVRELVVNHVDVLRMLLSIYLEGDNKKQVETIKTEINEYKKKMGETKRIIPGRGEVLMKDIKGVNVEDPLWKEYINFKAERYREMFEILVNAYNAHKADIRALEEE